MTNNFSPQIRVFWARPQHDKFRSQTHVVYGFHDENGWFVGLGVGCSSSVGHKGLRFSWQGAWPTPVCSVCRNYAQKIGFEATEQMKEVSFSQMLEDLTEAKVGNTEKPIFYSDPGHGEVRVPLKLALSLSISPIFSAYSSFWGPWAYLEEDSDAAKFMHHSGYTAEQFESRVVDVRPSNRIEMPPMSVAYYLRSNA